MNFDKLNPFVRSAAIYECVGRSEECVGADCRVVYLISGDLSAVVGGEKVGHLVPGGLLYIPAGVPYKLKGKMYMAAVLTFDFTADRADIDERIPPVSTSDFKAEGAHLLGIISPFDKYIKLDECESSRDAFERMCNLFTSREGEYRARVSALFKLELLKIAEAASPDALPARMVEELDSYIRENCSDEISNTELGAIFGYHPFYISRMLKDKKGITLRQYVISYRLKAAHRMLESTAKTVNEIADLLGFTDASYFTKVFKSEYGETPKEYRNRFKEQFI